MVKKSNIIKNLLIINAMAPFDSNWQNSMMGHLGYHEIAQSEGEGGKGKVSEGSDRYHPENRTPGSTSLDISDIMSNTVAKGYKSFSDEEVKANYKYLSNVLGQDQARKLFNQAFIFNQRPDMKGKGLEDRIQSFYEIGSNDESTGKILKSVKDWGAGPLARWNASTNEGNQIVSGKVNQGKKAADPDATGQLADLTTQKMAQQ